MSFTETDEIYASMDSVLGERKTSASGLNTVSIESGHVHQFHAALGVFRRHLLESEITDDWGTYLRSVKRWFHLYLTTPVEGASLLPLCPKVEGLGRLKQNSQPITEQLFDDLNTKFKILLQIEQHPFLDQIIGFLPEGIETENEQEHPYRLGVVVEGRRVCQHVSKWFDRFDIGVPAHVVTPSDLKNESHFDQLFLMGSPRWLALSGSMHVLNSPRANQLTFMGFEPFFTPLTVDNFYSFSGSPHVFSKASTQGLLSSPVFQDYTICVDEDDIEAEREDTEPISASEIDDIIPTIDSSKVFSSFDQPNPDDDETEVTASCHFGRLSANAGVFLNTEASVYRILLLQSNGTKLICHEIEKTPVTALVSGDIVMFSTHGAGDMTASIADSLLGGSAHSLREKQATWKMKVRTRFHLYRSHIELLNRGVLSASETNFKNWLRPHTIMPGNRQHFLKLLLLAGYSEDEAADTIIAMRRISAAHQSAGRKVAQMLRKSAKGTHLDQLEKKGMQVLHGKLGTSAEMTAYLIEQMDHREYELPISKLNHPFELTDDLWHA